MMNLLGGGMDRPRYSTRLVYPTQDSGTSLHLYGKREARKGRKMGAPYFKVATDREGKRLSKISQILQYKRPSNLVISSRS